MKKILLTSFIISLIINSLSADTYYGIEGGLGTDTMNYHVIEYATGDISEFTEYESYMDYRLKFGTGEDGGFKYEGFLGGYFYRDTPLNKYSFANDKSGFTIGFNIIKEFQRYNPKLLPYIKIGVTFDVAEDWSGDTYVLGGGAIYNLNDGLKVYVGIDFQYRDFIRNTADSITFDSTLTASSVRMLSGLNFSFD